MKQEEFNSKVARIMGVKSGKTEMAVISMRPEDHLDQRISLGIVPTEYQAKKLRNLAYEFGRVQPS